MFKAVYQGKPGSTIRIIHELGRYIFEGGAEQDVPDEVGKYLRHITKNGEVDPGFFTIDLDNLLAQYGVDTSRVEVPNPPKKKKKKKKTIKVDSTEEPVKKKKDGISDLVKLRRIKRKMRES